MKPDSSEPYRPLCLLALGLLCGCGANNGLAPVQGRVLLDGQPIAGAAVLFEPESGGVPATGVTDASGQFSLTTSGRGAGASLGKNSVCVSKQVIAQPNRKVEEGEIVAMKSETPVKYASPQTSGLTIDVKPGMPPVELQLQSGK
jgi:hypothetical protein